jgi:CAAX prenyl protease-like protein
MQFPLSRAALVRMAPFAVFVALLALPGALPNEASTGIDPRWATGWSALVAGGLLLWFWREYGELAAQTLPTLGEAMVAVGVGVAVFYLWITLDAPWMRWGEATAGFRPVDAHGQLMWPLVLARWCGAVLVVPVMEELFWRSFLMRWIEQVPFEGVDPRRVGPKAIALSSFVFMLAHTLWLAALVTGLGYAWLYVRSGKLWLPVIAHAVTNGVLGVWVVFTGNWGYW